MQTYTDTNATTANDSARKHNNRIILGNCILAATLIIAFISICIGFVFEDQFSLSVQIAAHISIIICSLTLKIGYLLRSFALKHLGSNQF
jgi:hypothetical protein